ncbi:efflux transporter, RND family, MFP subunit [Chitinispirillum alkaliphilum]|nr:efflux transporter, RND family, MFP subunit [Chitinispirillum alkaliphilum]
MNRSIVAIIIGIFLFLMSCEGQQENTAESSDITEAPRAVEARNIILSSVKRTVQTSSTIRGVHEVTVVSQTSGKILRTALGLGQFVRQGAVLVEVESQVQAAAVKQARAAYESAALNLDVVEKLHQQNGASMAELTGSRTSYTAAKASLAQARNAYDKTRITAPVSGYIAFKESVVERGNVVSPGMVITRVVNLGSLIATVAVSESEMNLIEKGMDVYVRVPALGDTLFSGKVTGVGAGSFASTGSFPVEVSFENTSDHRVKSGMAANVIIESETIQRSILVPLSAITERERKQVVYTAVNDRAAMNFIHTGRIIGDYIEIVEGLEEGQTLVLTGLTNLSAGDSLSLTIVE